MIEALQLFEHRYFPENGNGNASLGERDSNLLESHHLTIVGQISSLEDRTIRARAYEGHFFVVLVLDVPNELSHNYILQITKLTLDSLKRLA